jgi:Ca2+-binding RTX toxin-like protein
MLKTSAGPIDRRRCLPTEEADWGIRFHMTTYIGTSGDDLYTGGKFGDLIDGAAGDDTLSGADGSDRIQGGDGADSLAGGDDNDVIASYLLDLDPGPYPDWSGGSRDIYDERDTLLGGAGADTLAAGFGDDVDGGLGGDSLYINFSGATAGVTAIFDSLSEGPVIVGGATIQNVEYVTYIQGTNFADVLSGSATIHGGGGDDSIAGGGYSAAVFGDGGNDVIDARGWSFGEVHGGNGDDIIDDRGASFRQVYGDAGDDFVQTTGTVNGGAGNDTIEIVAGSFGRIFGNDGDDLLQATSAASRSAFMFGGSGADTLISADNGATLFSQGQTGGGGDYDFGLEHDVLVAGDSNDRLNIGYGDDADGGDGFDTISMSWVGAPAGVTVTTADIVAGSYSFGGGVVQNVEKLSELYFSDHDDVVTVSPQSALVLVHGRRGNDWICDSDARAQISGDEGDDTLVGGGNGTVLSGNGGNDLFVVRATEVKVTELANEGLDTVRSSIDYTLGANVENLTLVGAATGAGNGLANLIAGDEAANSLTGLGGDDTLAGGDGADTLLGGDNADRLDGGSGNDEARGGRGDDLYIVDSAGDLVIESAAQGHDLVRSAADFVLGDNVEALVLTGSAAVGVGNGLANLVTGNTSANEISSLGGDDTLIGGGGADTLAGGDDDDRLDGGAGDDEMQGGAGDDLYLVDSTSDVVAELAGQGHDTVRASVDCTLGADVDDLLLTGAGASDGVGNAIDNVLTGNGADNDLQGLGGDDTLLGGGGADALTGGDNDDLLDGGGGDDLMVGGAGNDLYVADSVGDRAIEAAEGGVDEVLASVSYTLRPEVENLSLTGRSEIDGTGNRGDNHLVGNSAANVLTGLDGDDVLRGLGGNDRLEAGRGRDLMAGGQGDDLYIVNDQFDAITEVRKQGIDSVESSISYILAPEVENLTLTGTKALSARGNDLDNILTGNTRDNFFVGGRGADVMIGGEGSDTFSYAAARDSGPGSSDLLADFTADDRIDLLALDADGPKGPGGAFVRLAGDGDFTAAGQLRLVFDGVNTHLELNMDKDADAEMVILLAGDHTEASATDGWVL